MIVGSADDSEMQEAVAATLAAAGVTAEELRQQAVQSRFRIRACTHGVVRSAGAAGRRNRSRSLQPGTAKGRTR